MLKDTRYRVILFIIIAILCIVGIFVYFNMQKEEVNVSEVALKGTPNIRSIPGETKAPEAYRSAVEAQNIAQAERAAKEGGSAVPTIVQPTYQGPERFPVQPGMIAPGCNADELTKARAAGVRAEELRCKGCTAEQLRRAGYSAGELKTAGFTAEQLKKAGFSGAELKKAGFSAAELKEAGFSGAELKEAGFSGAELKKAGFSAPELKKAGFTALSIAQGTEKDRNCSPEALKKALASNLSPAQISQLNCDAKSLRAAGFSADQLRKAGFTAGELKEAGYSPKELKSAGFTPTELKEAGFTAAQLKEVGFTPEELKNGGYSRGDLLRAGFSPTELKEGGVSSPLSENFPKDCSPEALKRAHAANVPLSEIRRALGCNAKSLIAGGYSAKQLKDGGFSGEELKQAGLNPAELAALAADESSGFSPSTGVNSGSVNSGAKVLFPELGEGAGLPSIPPDKQAQFLSELRKRQTEQLTEQQRQAAMQQMVQSMQTQASDLLASWSPPPTQSFILVPESKQSEAAEKNGANNHNLEEPKGIVIKAGTVMFGALETGINSDEDSPILATIIQGKIKGAKLLGSFSRRDKRVLVSFQTIDLPGVRNSIGVNAVAIDPEVARTALASRVDNHYLLRYGTLFASSFISGLANAIMQSNSRTAVNAATGLVVQETPKLNAGKEVLVALGNVGQQYASVLGQNFTVPPTVYVDPGSGVGILFMQDLVIPEDNDQLNSVLAKDEVKAKERKKEARIDTRERLEQERLDIERERGAYYNESMQPVVPPQIIPQQPLQFQPQPQRVIQPQLGQIRQP